MAEVVDDRARGGGGGALVLADAEATARAGAALAALVQGGDAVALVGDLGAGKTTLVAGLARALGAGAASSPTFSLVNEYPGGRLVVWHVDLYRIEREAELVELGLDDLLGEPRGVCLVEWADRFAVMPPDHLRLELAHASGTDGGDRRELLARGTGPRGRALARGLEAALLAST
jgi:tRNA threonylcarbamoyladenosine biosynthesis protein TsaE